MQAQSLYYVFVDDDYAAREGGWDKYYLPCDPKYLFFYWLNYNICPYMVKY